MNEQQMAAKAAALQSYIYPILPSHDQTTQAS
jgi:hypothetical protein